MVCSCVKGTIKVLYLNLTSCHVNKIQPNFLNDKRFTLYDPKIVLIQFHFSSCLFLFLMGFKKTYSYKNPWGSSLYIVLFWPKKKHMETTKLPTMSTIPRAQTAGSKGSEKWVWPCSSGDPTEAIKGGPLPVINGIISPISTMGTHNLHF